MISIDRFTGKLMDKPSDSLPTVSVEICEDCGSRLINRCVRCGAPVCCPECCQASDKQLNNLEVG